jgi:hypothetical protein
MTNQKLKATLFLMLWVKGRVVLVRGHLGGMMKRVVELTHFCGFPVGRQRVIISHI